MKFVLLLALVVAVTSSCARAHAKTTLESPPLDMPASPPREVEPSDVETPPPVPLPQEPAHNALPRPTPAREQPRPEPAKPEPPKPEPPPPEPPKPEEPPKPPTMLQTTSTTAEGEVDRIRATIGRASADLNRIDAKRLNPDARTQYDTAKSFIRQAEAAIGAKNLVFAKNLAEKAAALAAQLAPK